MPIPKPKPNEAQGKYISRCVAFLVGEGREAAQAAAICHDLWSKKDEGAFDGLLTKQRGDDGNE
jgi:hypothetical protein